MRRWWVSNDVPQRAGSSRARIARIETVGGDAVSWAGTPRLAWGRGKFGSDSSVARDCGTIGILAIPKVPVFLFLLGLD